MLSASPPPEPADSNLPVLVFAIAYTVIAVPLTTVSQVIRTPEALRSQTHEISLMHWQHQQITLLNLYRRLAPHYPQQIQTLSPFLVLLETPQAERYAIPTQDPPSLFTLPLVSIRPLPEAYRRSLPLDLASHMAILPRPNTPLTLYLLDLQRLVRSLLA